jgi:Arc/MetJ family transcription regulator
MLPAYQDSCDQIKQGGDITLSMINLNKLGALDAALDRLVADVRAASAIPALLRARGQALSFGKNPNPAYDRDLVDVADLVRQLAQLSPQLASASGAVEAAMKEALVSQVRGPAAQQASGLSIYLPSASIYYNAEYGSLGLAGQWPALVGELAGVEIPVGGRPTFTNPDHVAQIIEQEGQLGVVGQLSAETAGGVTEVRLYTALVVDEAAGQLIILSDSQGVLDPASSLAVGAWDQKLLVLNQGAKQSYGYLSTHAQGDYTVFMIPFGYAERPGQEQQIAFWTQVYDPAQGVVISSGFYGLSEGGTGQLTPAPGSVLSPLALVVEGGQASWSLLSDETFDANAMISSDLADIPAGSQIYMELNAKDAAGNLDYVYHVKNY